MPLSLPADYTPGLCARLLGDGRHHELSACLLAALDQVERSAGIDVSAAEQALLDGFYLVLMQCLAAPEFTITDPDQAQHWIAHNTTIAQIASASSFGTTDPVLRLVLAHPDNLVKVLALYSCRNSQKLDLSPVFDSHIELATLWYFAALGRDYAALTVGDAAPSLSGHLAAMDDRLLPAPGGMCLPYFLTTYAAPEVEPRVKSRINRLMRRHAGARAGCFEVESPGDSPEKLNPSLINKLEGDSDIRSRRGCADPMSSHSSPLPALGSPDPRHVVVISSLWASDHAVYRTNARFVEALAGHYRLTLVTNRNPAMETSGFERVIRLGDDGDPAALAGLDARVAFFPDVGMGEDSMRLANTRLAPIQVMSCGHPVSTFGAEIDYFISGDEVDDDDTAARFYSERLVLIPGRGVVANRIVQPRRFQDKPEGEAIRIGLPWSVPKINRRMLAVLRSVADRCRIPVEFHLFSGVGLWKMGLPPFRKALEAQLGDGRVVLYPYLSAEAYLESLSHMHMAADSHPFGGFNTVVDCLHSGIPMVGFEGERAFSRYGPHLMRGLGLGELVATDHQGFADILVHLIDDAAWRSHWEGRVRALDLDATVYAEDNARHFRTAMDYLVANHETLTQSGSRAPIRIRPMTG